MELIDTHVHFWDQRLLSYPWLQAGVPHPILGDIDAIKSPLYDAGALLAETRFAGLRGAVHVEADAKASDPFAEPSWVRGMAARSPLPVSQVVHADLCSPGSAGDVAAFGAAADVVGIRDFGVVGYLRDPASAPAFAANLDAMARAGLILDLDCAWEDMPLAYELALAHPELRIVLEHIGYPRRRDDAYFTSWAPAIRRLAAAPNVHCKLSGLGMTDRGWTIGSLRRWVATCIEAFGPGRCLFGSNWPVDRIASSYDALTDAFAELIADLPFAGQRAILVGNAQALYFAGYFAGRPR
jgi:predicted TIM-barrel fold metal-dependent hydrolase